jgi:hypothetical protein
MNPRNRFRWIAIGILLCSGALALAQDEPDLQAIAASIQHNQESLHNYSWESRVSMTVDGEQKKVDLFKVRYDMDGQLQKTRMGGEADTKKVRGPIRKKVAKKKKKQAGEFGDELREQLATYTEPASLQKAIQSAFSKTEAGVFKLQANDVVEPGDSILIQVVAATGQPMSLTVNTAVEDSAVVLDVTFQKLDDGTNYVARSTIDTEYDGKKIEVVTENFGHLKQGG